ncbi:MAG: hypothetical protein GY838_05090 [bacterium]|nr:hypothetical protein [bacterium]
MDIDKITSLVSRVLFGVGALALTMGILEKFANMSGQTLTRGYTPERLLEVTVSVAILVCALLLRQVREATRQRN